MTETMKAIVWYGEGEGKLELRDVPIPQTGDDDILLEVKAAGICGSDLNIYSGAAYPPKHSLPMIPGHEFAGIIAKMGKNVDKYWKVGDRVISENTGYACGRCPSCSAGNYVNCADRECIGYTMDGAFTKYVRIPGEILKIYPNTLLRLPDSIGFNEAPCLEAAANSYKALIQEANFRSGESVVVFGPGSLGLMAVQHAKVAGAVNIIMVGLEKDKKVRFEIAKQFGATHCFAMEDERDIVKTIKEIVGSNGVAVTLDVVGAPSVTSLAIEVVRNEGTVIFIGSAFKKYEHTLMPISVKSITFRGHIGYNAESWRNTIALTDAGLFDLKGLVTATLPLEDFKNGYEMMKNQEAGKIILIP